MENILYTTVVIHTLHNQYIIGIVAFENTVVLKSHLNDRNTLSEQ